MNLALDFAHDVSAGAQVLALAAQFEASMQQDDSPVRAVRLLPAQAARYARFPEKLNSLLRQALASLRIENLYTHQAASIGHSLERRNAVVVTPTASGKTLCYNVPVLHRC